MHARLWTAAAAVLLALPAAPAAQSSDALPMALEQMLTAARARTPSPGEQREPRVGDVSASGELGYLIGPRRLERETGGTLHGVYLTIWKRQRNGRFSPVLDITTSTPGAPSFPTGFARAGPAGRFAEYDDTTPPLSAADSLLNAALRTDQVKGYEPRLSGQVRLHRPGLAPLVGRSAILGRLSGRPAFESADTRYSEAARSGDLGYTWGVYALGRAGGGERGTYVRVWVRERGGQWVLALDALQPDPA